MTYLGLLGAPGKSAIFEGTLDLQKLGDTAAGSNLCALNAQSQGT